MTETCEIILAALLLIDLLLVTTSRLLRCIHLAAFQGFLIGLFPLVMWDYSNHGMPGVGVILVAVAGCLIKGVMLPVLLRHAMDHARVKRELEPWVGYAASLGIVLALSALAFFLWAEFAIKPGNGPILTAPVAFTTMISGLFIIIARKKALTQVVGFLFFENGITVFGIGMAVEGGLLVELGILLDVLVLVFVMGIAMFHINREFSHIDAEKLNHLNELADDELDYSQDRGVEA